MGTTRFACVRRARAATPTARVPLVVFFHGGGDGASTAEETGLLAKTDTFDLGGAVAGFTLVAVHGRRIRFGTAANRDGEYHHDFYYRDLSSPSTNPDVANTDAWIDRMVQEGIVDPARIYVMGWSNGAFFGQLYAIARHETATPDTGSRVAAAAVFSAGDPFHGIDNNPFADPAFDPSTDGHLCRLDSYPSSPVPILVVYRTCDITVPCGEADRTCWGTNRGFSVDEWLERAPSVGLPNIAGFMIHGVEDEAGGPQDGDAAACSDIALRCATEERPTARACLTSLDAAGTLYCQCLLNHLRWPDGSYPGATQDRENGMLAYLRSHPRT